MRPVHQRKVHLAVKRVCRQGVPGLTVDEDYVFGSKIASSQAYSKAWSFSRS
jgi:hypothetical protein